MTIARLDGADLDEVESVFRQLDTEAAALYTLAVFGMTSAPLGAAVDDSGRHFDGFTHDGIWLVGLQCSTCINPAPLVLSVAEVD